MSSSLSSFAPVPRASDRADGWTPDKQRSFIDALCEYASVTAAAHKVGMTTGSAYRLRASDGAEGFAAAWDEATKVGFASLADIAMDRVINGVAIPHYYKGEKVGEHIRYDNRLLMFMLRQTNPRRYGPHAADYDFVDESLAAEKSAIDRKLELIRKAEEMIASLNDIFMYDIEQSISDSHQRLTTGERETIQRRMDALEEHIERLKMGLPTTMPAALLSAPPPQFPWSHKIAYAGSG